MSAVASFASALREAGAAQEFLHEGLIYTHGVPPECVAAYAKARIEKAPAPEILARMARAFMGALTVEPDDPRSVLWLCARAWAARLGALERDVRGRSLAPAKDQNSGRTNHV